MRRAILATWRLFDTLPVPPPVRFLLVGASGIGVNMGVLWALVSHFAMPSFVAVALAVETSICTNFLLNDVWTFGSGRRVRPWWARIAVFHGAAAVAASVLGVLLLAASAGGRIAIWRLPGRHQRRVDHQFRRQHDLDLACRPAPFREYLMSSVANSLKRIVVVPVQRAGTSAALSSILGLGREYEVLVVDSSRQAGDIVKGDGGGGIALSCRREDGHGTATVAASGGRWTSCRSDLPDGRLLPTGRKRRVQHRPAASSAPLRRRWVDAG
jgi:putative flippase GtrA